MSSMSQGLFLRFFLAASALLFAIGSGVGAKADDATAKKDREIEQLLKSFKTVETSSSDSELEKLLKERYNVSVEHARRVAAKILEGTVASARLSESIDRMTKAGLALWKDPKERIALLERKVRFAHMAEVFARDRFRDGTGSPEDYHQAKYDRLSAEIELLQEKAAAGKH